MNENPFAQDFSQPTITPPSLKLPYLKSWAAFYFLSLFLGLGAGAVVGFLVGLLMAAAGADLSNLQLFGAVGGFLIGLPISFICYRWSVDKFIVPAMGLRTFGG